MQTKPTNWAALFSGPHTTEYKYVIDGVDYSGINVQGTPIIKKPLLDKPGIGRFTSGSLTITVRKQRGVAIPKAASVVAYARLSSRDGETMTDWIEQGHYCISRRKESNGLAVLTCFDLMSKAGSKYIDHTAITEWPAPMSSVVNEIAEIMNVSIDARTVIHTGYDYVVDYPNDRLMSEVLGMIGAAHGGNWAMTEAGALRLIPFTSAAASAVQAVGSAFKKYHVISTARTVTRITLTDSAENQFTLGTDDGLELAAECDYATQAMLADIAGGCYQANGTVYGLTGPVSQTTLTIADASVSAGAAVLPPQTVNIPIHTYTLGGAYIDPCVELGDTISITKGDDTILLYIAAMDIRCNQSFNADVSFEAEEDDEDEYPYSDLTALRESRYISSSKTYFGNRLDRSNGLTSELMKNGSVVSRLVANASTFSMQQCVDGSWYDRIYFDAVAGKYKITGDVTVEGVLTAADVGTNGHTTICGDRITTGTIKSHGYSAGSQGMCINLDTGVIDSANFKLLANGNVSLSGSITTSSGKIGGFNINGSALYTASNAIYLGSSAVSKVINGVSRNVVFSAGSKYGVASDGTLYASDAVISGNITASALAANSTITSPTITGGSINIGSGQFMVDSTGSVTAKKGSFSGDLNAAGGTFKGKMKIGSCEISMPNNEDVEISGIGITLEADNIALSNSGSDVLQVASGFYLSPYWIHQSSGGNKYLAWSQDSGEVMYSNPSSIRVKENIREIGDIDFDRLHPVRFNYIFDKNHRENLSFIAEELEGVLPEAVTYEFCNGTLYPDGIDPMQIIPVLVAELQKVRQRLEALENAA